MASGTKKLTEILTIFNVSQVILLAAVLCVLGRVCIAEEKNELLSDIDQLASHGENAPSALLESVQNRIENDPAAVSSLFLARLSDSTATENQLAIYVWVLGLAGDTKATDEILVLAEKTTSELVKRNCLKALASIGGEKSGAFLMTALDKTKDPEMRYAVLNLLAQMQYEPALAKTEEVMKRDFKQYYWQSIFIFGKMGDKSVPFLLKRMSAGNKNIRASAITVLGQWLIAPEAAVPLRKRYWKEKDPAIRNLILSSLERVTSDLNEIEKFSAEVVAKEKEAALVKFAQETLAEIEGMKKKSLAFKENKLVSAAQFQKEYDELYRSAGIEGDYGILAITSCFEDEAKLKKLRERILLRDSDESFHDYQEINDIIMLNRFLQKQKISGGV